jgi:hypothetical protein
VKLTECSNSSAKGESLELCTELSQWNPLILLPYANSKTKFLKEYFRKKKDILSNHTSPILHKPLWFLHVTASVYIWSCLPSSPPWGRAQQVHAEGSDLPSVTARPQGERAVQLDSKAQQQSCTSKVWSPRLTLVLK